MARLALHPQLSGVVEVDVEYRLEELVAGRGLRRDRPDDRRHPWGLDDRRPAQRRTGSIPSPRRTPRSGPATSWSRSVPRPRSSASRRCSPRPEIRRPGPARHLKGRVAAVTLRSSSRGDLGVETTDITCVATSAARPQGHDAAHRRGAVRGDARVAVGGAGAGAGRSVGTRCARRPAGAVTLSPLAASNYAVAPVCARRTPTAPRCLALELDPALSGGPRAAPPDRDVAEGPRRGRRRRRSMREESRHGRVLRASSAGPPGRLLAAGADGPHSADGRDRGRLRRPLGGEGPQALRRNLRPARLQHPRQVPAAGQPARRKEAAAGNRRRVGTGDLDRPRGHPRDL